MRRPMLLAIFAASALSQAGPIPSPKAFFGHDVCEDYWLANYKQLTAYWQALAKASARFTFQSIGKTEDGREQWMAIITDPANHKGLEGYRKASLRLCAAKDFKSDDDAREFARKQKAVVWIDGGIHATEALATQQLIETAYRLTSSDDPETQRIRKDCIILLGHANPDGMDWVSDWYMRKEDPKARSLGGLPWLYQKYCGHDNNRDFYANNMAETRNINRILYSVWAPQIVYNHHQSAPAGTLMFIPPFRNPFNYHFDPMIDIATDLAGTHMHQRLIAEGKPGTAMRGSTLYSTWWNGGLRTTTYFHNMVGILTETWGSPSPAPLPFVNRFQIPSSDVPFPVEGGRLWHMRDSLEYEVSANYAILDYASRYRDRLLFDFYRAGRNSIERGSADHWTPYPSRIAQYGQDALRKPELRDARLYVVPSDQPDPAVAAKFIERLMQCGIEVHRLAADTAISLPVLANPNQSSPIRTSPERIWPAGSFVIRCDQAFRPHILDMFEPQDHPNDFQYAGGPPIPPYDSAGYTLAFQMGVKFDRVLDPIALATEPLTLDAVAALAKLPQVSGQQARVALWDRYGGSMESGWTRWVLEQYGYKFNVIYPPDIDAGSLRDKYDCIILPSGALSSGRGGGAPSGGESVEEALPFAQGGQDPQTDDPTIPLEWRKRMGSMGAKSVAQLREFVEQGGHLLCLGSSALAAARQLKLPVESALVDDKGAALPNTKFYVPGSVLRVKLNPGPLTSGMGEIVDVMFDNSPAFRLTKPNQLDPTLASPTVVALFDSAKPLRSGWAWGQETLKDTVAIADVPLGKGRVVLYGPEILFRGQPFGTFKLLFNAIARARG